MAWRVISSSRIRQEFKQQCERAASEGKLASFLEAMKQVHARLADNPHEVGEAKYRLKHLGLLICVVVQNPLLVQFGIDDQRQWVYLRKTDYRPR